LTKHQLLDEAFAIGSNFGNDSLRKIRKIENKLADYLKESGSDPQINDVLCVLKIFADENEHSDFEASQETATPIFDRLLHTDLWDFYDIRIMVTVFDYVGTYEQVSDCAKEILQRLEEYSYKECYTTIKISVHMNILFRLLRARYFDLEDMDDPAELKKIEDIFLAHFDSIMDICKDGSFPVYKIVATIRKGILFKDSKLMEEGFKALKKLNQHEAYRVFEDEAKEFERYSGYDVSRRRFNVMVGHNIRRERISCGLTIDDVAKILDMSIAALGLMERGDRGQTSYNLARLADAFGVSVGVFYNDVGDVPGATSVNRRKNAQIHKLEALAEGLSESELEHIVLITENLAKLRSNRGAS